MTTTLTQKIKLNGRVPSTTIITISLTCDHHYEKITLTQKIKLSGRVARQQRTETRARRRAQQPGESASPGMVMIMIMMMVIMMVMVMVMIVGMASPERPKVRNFMSFFRPVGSSAVSFSVSCVDPSLKKF